MSADQKQAPVVDKAWGTTAADGSVLLAAVPLDEILVDRNFNKRRAYAGIGQLAEEMKKIGQTTAIYATSIPEEMRAKAGKAKYYLLSGFRRMAALVEAKIPTAKVNFRAALSAKEMRIVNVIENEGREGFTTYELALSLHEMSSIGMTGPEIASAIRSGRQSEEAATGRAEYTKDYVNNLIRCVRNLHPNIVKAWEARNPKATLPRLIALAGKEHKDQLVAWEEAVGPASADPDAGPDTDSAPGDSKPRTDGPKKPTTVQLEDALTATRYLLRNPPTEKGARTEAELRMAEMVLKYALGSVKNIAGVYDHAVRKAMAYAKGKD